MSECVFVFDVSYADLSYTLTWLERCLQRNRRRRNAVILALLAQFIFLILKRSGNDFDLLLSTRFRLKQTRGEREGRAAAVIKKRVTL